jgi:hypothetical protein
VRRAMAFLYAPLWVPLIVVLVGSGISTPSGPSASGLIIPAVIAAFFAYLGMMVIGIPAYLFLRWRRWTSLWPAAAVGFVAGFAMANLVGLAVVGFWGGWTAAVRKVVLDPSANDLVAGLVSALVGVLVAATAWLIIRPDRERVVD